jgi:hypothetical protein
MLQFLFCKTDETAHVQSPNQTVEILNTKQKYKTVSLTLKLKRVSFMLNFDLE